MTVWYYLFSVLVFWTRPTVNTFMLLLLPNSVFAFYTCAVPAHWSLAGFKCVLLTSWFLESKPDRQWPRMLRFSVRSSFAWGGAAEFVPCETKLCLCKSASYINSVVKMRWKLWKSSKKLWKSSESSWPFLKTLLRTCASAHQRVGVPRGWGGRNMTVVRNTQF